jgi:hypothetical protein
LGGGLLAEAILVSPHDLLAEKILWRQCKVKRLAFLLFLAAAGVPVGVGVAVGVVMVMDR